MKVVRVKALVAVSNNGKGYHPGAEFEMEESVALAHVAAGQVEPLGKVRSLKPGEVPDETQAAGGVKATKASAVAAAQAEAAPAAPAKGSKD